jgi:hypothetical protein
MSAASTIRGVVSSWEGIREAPGNFGAVEFRLGKREIGHLHGNAWLDIPFPRRVRDELVDAGAAEPHHILPRSGWVTFRIRSAGDADRAVVLLRRSYDLITAQLERRRAQSATNKSS